ncbi:MAG: rRNA pseudouridine synthase [Clostridia bacterium]|nr:rRNA pseudouridine synthase [Clostridia bacterium]
MRLDKFISSSGLLSRSECAKAAKLGRIAVNGAVIKSTSVQIDPDVDRITLDGAPIRYEEFVYVMLHKPDGYVSATEDGRDPTVLELLPRELRKRDLFPCGRLDKHTTGLMLITDNGPLGHRLLSPKHHVAKTYAFTAKFPISDEDIRALESGVPIETKDGGSYLTKPARVTLTNDARTEGCITLVEGKYHQIKLMLVAVHNQITALTRVTFGPLTLDPDLKPGEWRYLTEDEVKALE